MTFIQEKHHSEAIELLRDLISIPSVLAEASEGAPFGKPIRKALDRVLDWCAEQGFETYCDPDGYYGYAEIGSGSELFAILCHLDVVPAGDRSEWKTDPFEAVLTDGSLYGRGTQDDKGPTVAALLAVKALMDAGVAFKKRIRFIFGTDEETLWRGMQRYAEIEPVADMGFAPDSSFPLTYAEKGLLQVKLHGAGSSELALEAGEAFNVVPAQATYTKGAVEQVVAYLQKYGYEYESSSDSVTVLGRSQHAKDAALGINAVTRLATALSDVKEHSALHFIARAIGEDATGKQLFGVIEDEPSGKLSVNVAGVTITPERSEVRLDIRIPVLANKDELVKTLATTAKQYGLEYEEYDYLAPLYVPLDSTLVSTLLEVYREHTGDQTPPQSSGGATYARTMANCVAYGAAFPHTIETEHNPNECIVLEDMYEAMAIYAQAVYRLTSQ